METICGLDIITKGIGAVSWSWTDGKVHLHRNKLNNLLYFPESPFNIISEIELDESMNDGEVTWVLTKRGYSIFTLDFGKYNKTIYYSEKMSSRIRDQIWP